MPCGVFYDMWAAVCYVGCPRLVVTCMVYGLLYGEFCFILCGLTYDLLSIVCYVGLCMLCWQLYYMWTLYVIWAIV